VRRVSVVDAVRLCLQNGGCSEGEIAYWLDVSPSTAYHLFRLLKDLCERGFLTAGGEKCEVVGGRIVIRRTGESGGGKA
jgi:DNA-binding IclR family transcriptional regulator